MDSQAADGRKTGHAIVEIDFELAQTWVVLQNRPQTGSMFGIRSPSNSQKSTLDSHSDFGTKAVALQYSGTGSLINCKDKILAARIGWFVSAFHSDTRRASRKISRNSRCSGTILVWSVLEANAGKKYLTDSILCNVQFPTHPHRRIHRPGASTAAGPSSSTLASPTAFASGSGASTSSTQTHAATRLATNADAATSNPLLHQPLLSASNAAPEQGVLRRVSPDVIPFAGVFTGVSAWLRSFGAQHQAEVEGRKSRHWNKSSRRRYPCYHDNDLDLDMSCREIIRQDLQSLKKAPRQNAWPPLSLSVTGRPHTAAPAEHSHLLRESNSTKSTSNAGSMHGHGRNMFHASLARPSDTVSIQQESETVTGDLLSDFEPSLWVQNR
ncbi:hypothetical protein C8R44DRAFT_879560 [Mycena epipterygia]|nr:hypothetical protein C8R44DRAFT_879560 [Mycena epipterygia]